MKTDLYTRIILTVIAVCLTLIAFKMYFQPQALNAQNPQDDVYVVGGSLEIDNADEIALAIYNQLDGMNVRVTR